MNAGVSSRIERKYTIVPYQNKWEKEFEKIKKKISPVLDKLADEILHVGSTAVPGMSGKSCIDLLVIVKKIKAIDGAKKSLEKFGYVPLGECVAPGAVLFAKEKNNERLVNIHCSEGRHPLAQEMIAVRDYLLSHPDKAHEYSELKIALNKKYHSDYQSYRNIKSPFLDALTQDALKWQRNKHKK